MSIKLSTLYYIPLFLTPDSKISITFNVKKLLKVAVRLCSFDVYLISSHILRDFYRKQQLVLFDCNGIEHVVHVFVVQFLSYCKVL